MGTMSYDSTEDTQKHINRVGELIAHFSANMQARAEHHDATKLCSPEKEVFDSVTPRLKALTYGSDEHKSSLAEMGEALKHHYANNRHHPEHFTPVECIGCFTNVKAFVNGSCPQCGNTATASPLPTVNEMNLLDIVEMLCDWKAATERHADGSITMSLVINPKRFGIDDQLAGILRNTVRDLGWHDKERV